jgi:hypothetical protein
MSKVIFEKALRDITKTNQGNGSTEDQERYTPNFHSISRGISAAEDNISKTRARLLKEAQADPALKLLLYRTTTENKKVLRQWSEMLFRLSMAQFVILKQLSKEKRVTPEMLEVQFPEARLSSIRHVLKAVSFVVSDALTESNKILKQLIEEPIRYERLNRWLVTKNHYIDIMLRGFLTCHLTISAPAYRQENKDRWYAVHNKEGSYGIYKEKADRTGLVTSTLEYLDTDLSDLNPTQIKAIMDELTILSPRESMVWFINELFDCLMADFDWDKTVYFAQFVYKTLCHI